MTDTKTVVKPTEIELLAPARDAATAIAAIDHGADAVYMGAASFGARAQAGNPVEEIAAVARHAHRFGARVYVTVNTIIYDHELEEARRLIWDLWRADVDAVIVQDLALTRMEGLPPIALHASTQCDTRDPEKARFLAQCGFTRLVLARELTLDEIRRIREAVDTDLEVFVHGALCVSYSGDCQASLAITGRSANRGECCQVCRFKFNLEDNAGNTLVKGKHLLSLRDMNRLDNLEALLDAGATSLKIEGRLKDEAYVKNVVGAYRRKLDSIIAAHPDRYRRASYGRTELTFTPDPALSFNRGFTNYFLTSPSPAAGSLATFDSPKWIGTKVGKVTGRAQGGKAINATLYKPLNNGDGLGFYTRDGEFRGFRLNRVDGDRLYPAGDITVPPGAILYRNADKERADILASKTATRKLAVEMELKWTGNQVTLSLRDETGLEVTVAEEAERQEARSPQEERRRKELEKLGDTIFHAASVTDLCGQSFIPASTLGRLRRNGAQMLDIARQTTHRRELPGKPSVDVMLPQGKQLSRHDNIANHVAADFYASLSCQAASSIPKAMETTGKPAGETRVMETRYCLRREMGACLKNKEGNKLPSPLYLTSEGKRFRLDFDCRNCRMQVVYIP
ncbi:MAG: U32 family peptidase [Muribaculaceae bacterium]|jgi:putative protease